MARQAECVEFLQWCLPRLRMRWPGFRRVRSQVCKRIARRQRELGLEGFEAYRGYLESHGDEWNRLDALCRITISRFYRDRGVFEALGSVVLPALASAALERSDRVLRGWSCGAASGEEAYSLAMLWDARIAAALPGIQLEITATDSDPKMLERAGRGVYTAGSLRELPDDLREVGLEIHGEMFRVRDRTREKVSWMCQDVRAEALSGPFDLILCRNLVLTYFDETLQREVMDRIVAALRTGGALIVGSHESLPPLAIECEGWGGRLPIFRRIA